MTDSKHPSHPIHTATKTVHPAAVMPEAEARKIHVTSIADLEHERRQELVKAANKTLASETATDAEKEAAKAVIRATPIAGDRKLPPPGATDQG